MMVVEVVFWGNIYSSSSCIPWEVASNSTFTMTLPTIIIYDEREESGETQRIVAMRFRVSPQYNAMSDRLPITLTETTRTKPEGSTLHHRPLTIEPYKENVHLSPIGIIRFGAWRDRHSKKGSPRNANRIVTLHNQRRRLLCTDDSPLHDGATMILWTLDCTSCALGLKIVTTNRWKVVGTAYSTHHS